MIYLFTGAPGSYKTCRAISEILRFKKEGRVIYAHGIRDLDYERLGLKRFPDEDPSRWMELVGERPVFVLDECYTHFPNRNPGKAVPPHVEALATHRHHGVDFIMLAQQSVQLDPFIRGLIEEHIHMMKSRMVKGKATMKRWSEFQANTKGHCADSQVWVAPKENFTYYTSTVADTAKTRVPMWLKYLAAGIAFVALVSYGLKWRVESKIDERRAEHAAANGIGPDGRSVAASRSGRITYATPEAYGEAHAPRFANDPGSAPIYDQIEVKQRPRLACMASGSNHEKCTCLTQQGTKWPMQLAQCVDIAINGPPFNPYLDPPAPAAAPTPPIQPTPAPAPAIPAPIATGTAQTAQQAAYGAIGYGPHAGGGAGAPR